MNELTEKQKTWKVHLDAAAAQGVALTEYASRHGLNVHSLYTAKQRIRDREVGGVRSFVRVSSTRIEQVTGGVQMTIRLANGSSMSVPYDPAMMVSVLRTLASL